MRKSFIKNLVYVCVVVLAVSCSKDNDGAPVTQEITATQVQTVVEIDNITGIADNIITDVFMDTTSATSKRSSQKQTDCYEGVYTDLGFTLTFDNCDGGSGHILDGTVSVSYEAGQDIITTFTATYTDFAVGDVLINGTRSFDFVYGQDAGSFSFDVTSNLTVVLENEDVVTLVGTQEFGFTIGANLESIVYTLSGDWTVTVNNDTYAVVVTETLEGDVSCTYLTSGVMSLSKNGLTVSVDFGDGECDDAATLTYPDGTVENITLDD
ncbi:MAG: hypothetical protein COA50_10095 [Flavobacteriaceae bacterium]|nr:MAG: hypothetical protein COA50_10095 [Flavobacteriaceae bacterium]